MTRMGPFGIYGAVDMGTYEAQGVAGLGFTEQRHEGVAGFNRDDERDAIVAFGVCV